LEAEPTPQKQRLELVDVAVEAEVQQHLRSSGAAYSASA
jgi:hypothetical protein